MMKDQYFDKCLPQSANANLAPEIRKPTSELGSANNLDIAKESGYTMFLNLANLV